MTIRGYVALVVLMAACARPKPPPAPPPRIQDSPPEQREALNGAARLGLEAEEQRWNIEAAKERKRQAAEREEAAASHKTVIPMPAPQTGGRSKADGGAPDSGPVNPVKSPP
ncbi:MAG TPA: hypothetical protein VHL80_18935 [Polyangia bacterium]|nr:hypothetical protein [Polyangia bacterium]